MKKLLLCLCLALCSFGFSANEKDDFVWITVGTDAMKSVRAEFADHLWPIRYQRHATNPDITIMRVTEKQADIIAKMMHVTHNRCGGYVAHRSYEQAIASGHRELHIANSSKLALTYNLDRAAEVATVMSAVTEQGIEDTIVTLSSYPTRYYTSTAAVDSANWLKSEWESYAAGRTDVSVDLFSHSWAMPSVVMTITGAHQPQDIVVLGGHLDSTSSTSSAPGADDDASGIASLSEAIRAALANGYVPARTLKIIGYAAEEVGLRGSADIADAAVAAGDNVIGVLQLDMTNYNGASNDIYMVQDYTNAAQNTFVNSLIDTYTSYTRGAIDCGYACSDHASWNNRGYPASFPFEATMSTHNPYIHTSNDTYSVTGNSAHALKFSKVAVAYLVEMAKGGLNGDPGTDPGPVGGGGGNDGTEIASNPASISGLGGTSGQQDRYYLDVPAGATNLSISTSGGSGDVDLYTRFGAAPTTGVYDCRPYAGGNSETCSEPNPAEGRHYIMLNAYSTYASVTLSVSYDVPGGNNPPSASFSANTSSLSANFTDTSSDADGSLVSWSWTFGDGASASTQNPSHTYASAGTYTVGLTVTDNDGASNSASQSVSVSSGTGWIELSNAGFESGFAPYTDGGSDCARASNSSYAHQGTYSALIQDNTSTSNFTTTGTLALAGRSDLKIDFWFIASSMENGEDFFLEYYNGSSWQAIGNWARGAEFNNGSFYNPSVTISSDTFTFNDSAKIRFRCDASGNNDRIYIDDVVVSTR